MLLDPLPEGVTRKRVDHSVQMVSCQTFALPRKLCFAICIVGNRLKRCEIFPQARRLTRLRANRPLGECGLFFWLLTKRVRFRWMRFAVDILETLNADVRVELCRVEFLVTKKHLQRTQVGAVFHHQCRGGVTE